MDRLIFDSVRCRWGRPSQEQHENYIEKGLPGPAACHMCRSIHCHHHGEDSKLKIAGTTPIDHDVMSRRCWWTHFFHFDGKQFTRLERYQHQSRRDKVHSWKLRGTGAVSSFVTSRPVQACPTSPASRSHHKLAGVQFKAPAFRRPVVVIIFMEIFPPQHHSCKASSHASHQLQAP